MTEIQLKVHVTFDQKDLLALRQTVERLTNILLPLLTDTSRQPTINGPGPAQNANRPSWAELESVIPLETRSRTGGLSVRSITSLSVEAIHKHYPEYVVKLSPKRFGMKLRNALSIADNKK